MMPLRVSTSRLLADGEVARLRFRDAQFGLEPRRIGDAREVGARRDLLADVDGDLLEHARHAGAHPAADRPAAAAA